MVAYGVLTFKIYFDESEYIALMKDPVETLAVIDEVQESSKYKKGFEIKQFAILYSFSNEDKKYTGRYDVSADYYEPFKNKSSLDIVFNRTDPMLNKSKRSVQLREANGTFSEKLLKLIIFAFVVSLIPYALIGLPLGWVKLK